MNNQENLEEYFVFETYDREGKIEHQSPFFSQNGFEHLIKIFCKNVKKRIPLVERVIGEKVYTNKQSKDFKDLRAYYVLSEKKKGFPYNGFHFSVQILSFMTDIDNENKTEIKINEKLLNSINKFDDFIKFFEIYGK